MAHRVPGLLQAYPDVQMMRHLNDRHSSQPFRAERVEPASSASGARVASLGGIQVVTEDCCRATLLLPPEIFPGHCVQGR